MKGILITIFLAGMFNLSHSQESLKFPPLKNSLSLEFTAPVSYLLEISSHAPPSPAFYLPTISIIGEARIKNIFYAEFGFIPYSRRSDVIIINPENTAGRVVNYTIYAGTLFKFHVVNKLFFTPSLDLYFQRNLELPAASYVYPANSIYLAIGPTMGFEYYFSKRFSINTDLLNINYGLKFDLFQNPSPQSNQRFLAEHGHASIYKMFSLGFHYNFNWNKAH